MNTDEYKQCMHDKSVLDFSTLKATVEELERLDAKRLVMEIERILTSNKIEKPKFHNKQDDQTTDYYRIDLSSDDIEAIVEMFGDLEVGSLGDKYETTRAASLYATMLDNWNRIILD